MAQKKADSIEHHLRDKEKDTNSHAFSQLENDFRAKYAKQNEIVEKNFDLPPAEFVVDHYACAHYGKIPKQGRLFITPKFILFFANILGKKVKKKIPFDLIEEIKKDSVTLLAVAPIEIQLKYKRFTFVSFLHREKAFNNLLLQWKSNKEGKPYVIKIPLDEEEDGGEEGESASLSNNQAQEPQSGRSTLEVESMWGGSQTSGVILSDETTSPPAKKRGGNLLGSMPKLYSGSSDPDKKRSCLSCLPCFS